MLELFKGLDIFDPKFYIPVLIGVIVLFIILKLAKNLFKIALIVAVIALAFFVYTNLPNIEVEGNTATLQIKGEEYVINIKDVQLKTEEGKDGQEKLYLVSEGKVIVELPFGLDYAKEFLLKKLDLPDLAQDETTAG